MDDVTPRILPVLNELIGYLKNKKKNSNVPDGVEPSEYTTFDSTGDTKTAQKEFVTLFCNTLFEKPRIENFAKTFAQKFISVWQAAQPPKEKDIEILSQPAEKSISTLPAGKTTTVEKPAVQEKGSLLNNIASLLGALALGGITLAGMEGKLSSGVYKIIYGIGKFALKLLWRIVTGGSLSISKPIAEFGLYIMKKIGSVFSWGREIVAKIFPSLGKKLEQNVLKEGVEVAAKKGAGVAGKSVMARIFGNILKVGVLKRIPVIGSLISLGFAIHKFSAGNIAGGFVELLSGMLGLLDLVAPGLGTVLSIATDLIFGISNEEAAAKQQASPNKTSASNGLGKAQQTIWEKIKQSIFKPVIGWLPDWMQSTVGDWFGIDMADKTDKANIKPPLKKELKIPNMLPLEDESTRIRFKNEEEFKPIEVEIHPNNLPKKMSWVSDIVTDTDKTDTSFTNVNDMFTRATDKFSETIKSTFGAEEVKNIGRVLTDQLDTQRQLLITSMKTNEILANLNTQSSTSITNISTDKGSKTRVTTPFDNRMKYELSPYYAT